MAYSTPTGADYRQFIGMPVCAVLKDGSIYCGTISAIENNEIILQGLLGEHKVSQRPEQAKAQIAALGGLGALFGGGGANGANTGAAPGGGLGGMLGGLGGIGGMSGMGNWFKIGMSVVQFIFPLMKGFGF